MSSLEFAARKSGVREPEGGFDNLWSKVAVKWQYPVIDILGLRIWIVLLLLSIWELPGLCKGVNCVIAVIGVIEAELEQTRLFRGERMPLCLGMFAF